MSVLARFYRNPSLLCIQYGRLQSTSSDIKEVGDEEFRVLDFTNKRQRMKRKVAQRGDIQPDRADRMATNQNWTNVWPGPKTFHPASVPLPLRQGYVPHGQSPPGKKANAELMKIPNFLHLTPPAIKSQCEAIKKFCTPWPSLLTNEEAIEKHYPVEIITSDYCHASPTIRNPLARIVILRVKLSSLNLDTHGRDKFLRLVGDRYDQKTDLVTITADRCPVRKQNQDYVNYLLTACYHEALNVEEWEKDKTEEDMEVYIFENNKSMENIAKWYGSVASIENVKLQDIPNGEVFKTAVSKLFNDGESESTIDEYDKAVRKVLGLPDKE